MHRRFAGENSSKTSLSCWLSTHEKILTVDNLRKCKKITIDSNLHSFIVCDFGPCLISVWDYVLLLEDSKLVNILQWMDWCGFEYSCWPNIVNWVI